MLKRRVYNMTDERIDIEVTDKVDPGTATKLRDIAAAATEADTALGRLKKNSGDVDSSAVEKLEKAASQLTKETSDLTKAKVVDEKATKKATKANEDNAKSLKNVDEAVESVIVDLKAGVPATTALRGAIAGLLTTALPLIAITAALAGAQALLNNILNGNKEKVEEYENAIGDLQDSISELRDVNQLASSDLEEQAQVYGGTEEEIRSYIAALQAVKEQRANEQLRETLDLLGEIKLLGRFEIAIGGINAGGHRQRNSISFLRNELGLTREEAKALNQDFVSLRNASSFEEAAEHAANLREKVTAIGGEFADSVLPTLVDFEGQARSAFATVEEGATDAEKAIDRAEQSMARLVERFDAANSTAQLQLEFRGDPVGLAGALAEQEALRAQSSLRGAPGADIGELDAQVAAIRQQAEETEKLRQRTIALNEAERQRAADKRKADADEKRQADQKQRDDERAQRQAEAAFKRQQGQYDRLRSTILNFDDSDAGRIAQIREVENKRVEIVRESLRQNVIDHTQAQADIVAIQQQAARDINAVKFPGGEAILNNLRGPMMEYEETIRTLNELMRLGKITAEEYNAVLANTSVGSGIQDIERLLKPDFELEIEDLNTFYEERFRIIDEARRADLANKEYYDSLQVELERKKQQEIVAIEQARHDMVLAASTQGLGDLSSLAKAFAGEQSGIYKGLFAAHKAFATAEAIINTERAVSSALADYPFPINLVVAGAAAARGAVSIAKINGAGFMEGGYTGNIPTTAIAGAVHGQEYVFDAAATRRIGVSNLEALRTGAINDNAGIHRSFRETDGGVNRLQMSMPNIVVNNNGTPQTYSVQSVTQEEIRLIAQDVVQKDTPKLVTSQLSRANSPISKSLSQNTNTIRKR